MRRLSGTGWTGRVGFLGAVLALLPASATAQVDARAPAGHRDAATAAAAQPGAAPRLSEAARAALAAARELAGKAKGLDGPAEIAALQAAAVAYDKLATDSLATEPAAAAQAAFAAADLWRRQGSAAEAERDYLAAARLDPEHHGQRGKLGAADMQRRQDRDADALATYAEVVAIDPTSNRAQTARLWQGRVLQRVGRGDEAVAAFRGAVAAAHTPHQIIEASNFLARALVDKGAFVAAAQAIAHADTTVGEAPSDDPVQKERLQKALETMSARRALQRARDKQDNVAGEAQRLEESQRGGR